MSCDYRCCIFAAPVFLIFSKGAKVSASSNASPKGQLGGKNATVTESTSRLLITLAMILVLMIAGLGNSFSFPDLSNLSGSPDEKAGASPERNIHLYELDFPLFQLSSHEQDFVSLRQLAEGLIVTGGIGSGKSTGSAFLVANSLLKSGQGGTILTAKPEETSVWLEWIRNAGREQDAILINELGQHSYNFLRYEMKRQGRGAGYTENVVRLFTSVSEALQGGKLGQGENAYWLMAMQQLLRNAITLLHTVLGEVSVIMLQEVIQAAPTSIEQTFLEEWQTESLVNKLINEGHAMQEEVEQRSPDGQWQWLDFKAAGTYFMQEYPQFGDRLRSSIVSQFTSLADMFTRRPFRQLFCDKTTVVPEMSREGKLIILDLPVREFGDAGRAAQIMWKYMFQKAMERDSATANDLPPVFLYADEAQEFVSEYDYQFLATARSSRVCTVYITPNLPNLYARMGGEGAKARVDSLIGNFGTKIMHANSDPQTNEYFASVIGKSWQEIQGSNDTAGSSGASFGNSISKVFEYEVPAQRFTKLTKGGPPNWTTEAIVFQNGRKWAASEKTYLTVAFNNKNNMKGKL